MAMRLTLISIFISISALILSEIIFDRILRYKRDLMKNIVSIKTKYLTL